MTLPVPHPLAPMEARTVEAVPDGDGWRYDPKWDGFRCLAFRDGSDVELQSKAQKSLTRYFPELAEALRAPGSRQFVLDGELVVPVEGAFSFDHLLQRIHPAESRVRKLAGETPAWFIAFDLLARGEKTSYLERPFSRRREELEDFAGRYFDREDLRLSPSTAEVEVARRWFEELRGVDGVIAKRADEPYRVGEREGMVKVKRLRTADCVVGGFRRGKSGRGIGSLLLGLYDDEGLLHHVGFTSSFSAGERPRVLERVEPLVEPPGFTGNAPGGPSRWSGGEEKPWEPLRPELVVEVVYDHFSGGRFRHGTNFHRWRPDKDPSACTLDQVGRVGAGAYDLLTKGAAGG